MKLKKIKELDYVYGEEERIKQIIYTSKEPILIKIKNFTDKFSLDYFASRFDGKTTYSIFENDLCVGHQEVDFQTAMMEIKNNMPYRIFGLFIPRKESELIESYIPLWNKIPCRPRFFEQLFKVGYFFGGKGSHTEMHFDREQCCNLHICLSGKKQVLLFTEDQSDNLYKLPFIGDTLIDFGLPFTTISNEFPRINQASGYDVFLEQGDMLFMPRNCWHYTTYIDASSSATYIFYPKKILQICGYFTGHFFLGYKSAEGFRVSEWPIFKKLNRNYAFAVGWKKYGFKIIEKVLLVFMLPIISLMHAIVYYFKKWTSSSS